MGIDGGGGVGGWYEEAGKEMDAKFLGSSSNCRYRKQLCLTAQFGPLLLALREAVVFFGACSQLEMRTYLFLLVFFFVFLYVND